MNIQKAYTVRVEEQPGDCTRYTHILTLDERTGYVQANKDLMKGGAGADVLVPDWAIKEFKELGEAMSGLDLSAQASLVRDRYSIISSNINYYTLASIFRSIIKVF